MSKVIEAVYENGVFKPLEKITLKNGTRLKIEIRESITEKTKGIIDREKINDIIEEIESGGIL